MFDAGNRLIAALDVPSRAAADDLVARLDDVPRGVKVGLELFGACGPRIVEDYARHRAVMLDLKLHDIPETVGRAVSRLAGLGAALLTVHAAGGKAMLEAAVAAAKAAGETRIIAVTVLTSLDDADLRSVGIAIGTLETVMLRAKLAIAAGCHGIVASPHEVAAVRAVTPAGFLIVTPGVRPANGATSDDQKRVTTPHAARQAGADLVVVGRPLRDAANPAAAARAIVADLAS